MKRIPTLEDMKMWAYCGEHTRGCQCPDCCPSRYVHPRKWPTLVYAIGPSIEEQEKAQKPENKRPTKRKDVISLAVCACVWPRVHNGFCLDCGKRDPLEGSGK